MADVDVLERLRAANPVPDCPPPAIDDLWRRIDEDHAPASLARLLRLRRPPIGGVMAAVSTATALAVVFLAIALLGHTHTSSTAATGSGGTAPSRTHPGPVQGPATLRARIRALRGTPIVIHVWASWCAPCRREFPLFAAASERYRQRVAFIGVDVGDSSDAARSFLAHHPVSYPNYRVTLAELRARAIMPGVPGTLQGLPTTLFLDSTGQIAHDHVGEYTAPDALDADIAHLVQIPSRIQTVPPEVKAAFAVFRRPRTTADALPADVERRFTQPTPGHAWIGSNPDLARRVGNDQTFGFLVPGKTDMCLIYDGGSTCIPTQGAITGGLLGESFGTNSYPEVVTGVVPDSASTVTFKLVGGGSQTVAVHNNLYRADLPRRATTMTFTGRSGPVSVAL